MGIKIAGIDVSGIVKKEIGDKVLNSPEHSATLTLFTEGTRTGNLTGGTNPTSTAHTCKAFIDTQARRSVGGTLVDDGHVIVGIIGDTIVPAGAPRSEDTIALEGRTYRIKKIDRDPAAAMYTCLTKSV